MIFNLELTGEEVQAIRTALMRQSNQAYQSGNEAKSLKLDKIEGNILDQIYQQNDPVLERNN